jgi:hypothetical protein
MLSCFKNVVESSRHASASYTTKQELAGLLPLQLQLIPSSLVFFLVACSASRPWRCSTKRRITTRTVVYTPCMINNKCISFTIHHGSNGVATGMASGIDYFLSAMACRRGVQERRGMPPWCTGTACATESATASGGQTITITSCQTSATWWSSLRRSTASTISFCCDMILRSTRRWVLLSSMMGASVDKLDWVHRSSRMTGAACGRQCCQYGDNDGCMRAELLSMGACHNLGCVPNCCCYCCCQYTPPHLKKIGGKLSGSILDLLFKMLLVRASVA